MSKTETKLVLNARPANIKRTVSFDRVDGGRAQIPVSYVYRTRSEFAKAVAEHAELAKVDAEALIAKATAEDRVPTVEEEDAMLVRSHVKWLMTSLDGWGLDAEFNEENVHQLAVVFPAGVQAIIDDYSRVMKQGRLGN